MKNQSVVVTSIGLDGEQVDQITLLEKPEIVVYPGMYIITATETLRMISGKYEIIHDLCIDTSLGEIVFIKILTESLCLLAGPSTNNEMDLALQQIKNTFFEHVFIDGAFSKKTNAMITDGFIYVVGSSYSKNENKVIEDAIIDIDFFRLSKSVIDFKIQSDKNRIIIFDQDDQATFMPTSSLFETDSFFDTLDERIYTVYLPKALTNKEAISWMNLQKHRDVKLVLKNAFMIQVNNQVLHKLHHYRFKISYLETSKLLAVCVNPYSVYERLNSKKSILTRLRKNIDIPVYDVKEERNE